MSVKLEHRPIESQSQDQISHRLFVGFSLPQAAVAALWDLKETFPEIQASVIQKSHLTLCFIGKTFKVAEIQTTLRNLKSPPLCLTLKDLGTFNQRIGSVLWASLSPQEPIISLQSQVELLIDGPIGALGPLSEVGHFEPSKDIGAGKEPNDFKLNDDAQGKLDQNSRAKPGDNRKFRPHITIARLKERPSQDLRRRLRAREGQIFGNEFRVESISLFSSRLTPSGAIYRILEEYPLSMPSP
jgi:2'-5' RNA ligase